MDWLFFVFLGSIIGIFSGFFGIGGGIILTPLLLLFGFPPAVVIGTSLMLSLGTSLGGAWAHFRMKNIHWSYVLIINIAGIVGTQLAVPLMLFLEERQLAEITISLCYIFLLGFFASSMLIPQTKRKPLIQNSPNKLIAVFIGLGAGFISAMLGVSGGFFLVPMLISLLRFAPKKAVGTSLASVIFIVFAGFISYSVQTPVNFGLGLLLIIGTLIGSPVGAKMTAFYSEKTMRTLLGSLYIVIIFSVIANLLQWQEVGLAVISCFTLLFFFLSLRILILQRVKQHS
ncbi:sulfite exporter TauE/SafE family protein [Halalkalibacterium halodurans]|uniref:sulfite exporter TauE/SafE family protein n=1 Tax=Halalkalibacterium halodurans TaxID=86665 RepID=UPI002E1C3951|nr:sulfite exporter TauE/SafE family protein [Halalkalibacterium halodurans]